MSHFRFAERDPLAFAFSMFCNIEQQISFKKQKKSLLNSNYIIINMFYLKIINRLIVLINSLQF